jgi:hypothetical protein
VILAPGLRRLTNRKLHGVKGGDNRQASLQASVDKGVAWGKCGRCNLSMAAEAEGAELFDWN